MHPGLVTIETGKQTIQVAFPQRCVYCDKPSGTFQIIDVGGGQTVGKRSSSFSTQLVVPYCLDHSIVFNRYKKLLKGIGIPLFLIVFLGWFAMMMPFADFAEKYLPGFNLFLIPLIFPCIGNMILAFLAILLLHFILILFVPNFRQIPMITEHGGLGMKVRMNASLYAVNDLTFFFSNKDYASDFASLNNVPLSG